jgi:hypothetical protein
MKSASLKLALARTLLLVRDCVPTNVTDDHIVAALRSTVVSIVCDPAVVGTDAAQSAIVTLAILVLRMGCDVRLDFPEAPLAGGQAPLRGPLLREGLVDLGRDLLPGVGATVGAPVAGDVVFLIGPTVRALRGRNVWRVAWSQWTGAICEPARMRWPWAAEDSELGGLAAATLAATEVFKTVMRRLPLNDPAQFARTVEASVTLASCPPGRERRDIGRVDCVSAGALGQAFAYALLRVRGLRGRVRFMDSETADITNLNRYALTRLSNVGALKTMIVCTSASGELRFTGLDVHLDDEALERVQPLAPRLIVGTDNLASRWLAQSAMREGWLAISATDHFLSLTSEHAPGLGCARCLHDRDDGVVAQIPTVSFVSFWGGLTLAARLVRVAAGARVTTGEQVDLLWTLQLGGDHGRTRYDVACSRCLRAA